MFLSKFDFYKFDIQAVVIIILTVCMCLGINKYIEQDTPDKKNNETLIFLGGILLGFLISLIVSYVTLEADILDTSDYYN